MLDFDNKLYGTIQILKTNLRNSLVSQTLYSIARIKCNLPYIFDGAGFSDSKSISISPRRISDIFGE